MGILIVDDDVGIGCADWVVRAMVREISDVLREVGYLELAAWLMDDRSDPFLFGALDARELTPENQRAFSAAIGAACARSSERGPEGWRGGPSSWRGYQDYFENLAAQVELRAQGHSPTEWLNLSGIGPYGGRRVGPGWPADGTGA